jgi:hypothetical protein
MPYTIIVIPMGYISLERTIAGYLHGLRWSSGLCGRRYPGQCGVNVKELDYAWREFTLVVECHGCSEQGIHETGLGQSCSQGT